MFVFPQIVSLPAIGGMGSGIIEWPTIGVVVAWFAVAALVGTVLGTLRRGAANTPTPAEPNVVRLDTARVAARRSRDDHREAA